MNSFRDRRDAGRQLADALAEYADRDAVVLALPRGGVPVGYEVAKKLGFPLDVFLVRKLGVPGHEELAMGAIASGGVRVMNDDVMATAHIPPERVEQVAEREREELRRREQAYRGDRELLDISGKTAILVDDGLATGASMRAAVRAVRAGHPSEIILAVPTAPARTVREFRKVVDAVVCLVTPSPFFAVGGSYLDFSQTTDEEVRRLLADAGTFGRGP